MTTFNVTALAREGKKNRSLFSKTPWIFKILFKKRIQIGKFLFSFEISKKMGDYEINDN